MLYTPRLPENREQGTFLSPEAGGSGAAPAPRLSSLSRLLDAAPWQSLQSEEKEETVSMATQSSCLFSWQCGGWGPFFNYFLRRSSVVEICFRYVRIGLSIIST